MKQLLLCFILAPFMATGQMTFEHTYHGGDWGALVTFTDYGDKYAVIQYNGTGVINLYNDNHTLWKTLTPPPLPNCTINGSSVLSDKLMNNDGLIEYYTLYTDTSAQPDVMKIMIHQENNVTIALIDTTQGIYPYMQSDGSYKLITSPQYWVGGSVHVYGVPGTLPCVNCAALKVPGVQKKQAYIGEPVPNPSTGKVTIAFILPPDESAGTITLFNINGQLIQQYPVYRNQTSITIENQLAPGTYLYNLKTGASESETKKMAIK